MTLPARIREACRVKRFDVAGTQDLLIANVKLMVKQGVEEEDAIVLVGITYRTAQRELTTKPAKA